jgi:hypothetical protein
MSQAVHQIRFGWSPSSLLGTRGMGPVDSTLPADLLPVWDRYLRDHVSAADVQPGFTFIVREGVGALLRKVATTDGRPGSAARALLSPSLLAPAALGLTSWDGWHAPDLTVLSWSALEQAAGHGLRELRAQARSLPADHLAGLFAHLLSAPADSYTLIGEPDPLAVACALGDLLGETPTFASDERDDVRPDLPVAVFLREAPFSSTTATRRRLSPAAGHADPALLSFAAAAVDAYAADGPDGIAAIRRDRPPADLAEVRKWVKAAQFAPGVIADLTRLPGLSEAALASLSERHARERIKDAAAFASPRVLTHALDRRLPADIMSILTREAVSRIARVPAEHALLERLAQIGPLPLDLVAKCLPPDFDDLAHVTLGLLDPADRGTVLEHHARSIPLVRLIHWIGDHAQADPAGALALYPALCGRLPRASEADVATLLDLRVLVDAMRQISESEQHSSARVAALLDALPRNALAPGVIAALVTPGDPVLLHALDTVVTDLPTRELIHHQVRLAYYHSYGLPDPAAAPPQDIPADIEPARWRRFPSRHHPSHSRKAP